MSTSGGNSTFGGTTRFRGTNTSPTHPEAMLSVWDLDPVVPLNSPTLICVIVKHWV